MASIDPKGTSVDVSDVILVDNASSHTMKITKLVLGGCAVVVGVGLVTWAIVAIVMATSSDSATTLTPTTTTSGPNTTGPTTTTTIGITSTTTTGTTTSTTPGTTTTTTPGTTTTPPACSSCGYRIGRGLTDITGLIADGALYGYGDPSQDARGIQLRQYSRAFIFEDKSGDGKRLVIVSAEITMFTQASAKSIIEKLAEVFPDGRYDERNVMLSPTHSHAAPGGLNTYWMFMAATGGFIQQTFDVVVNGVVESIRLADADLHDSRLYVNNGEVPPEVSRNRAPYSYGFNPQEERDRYTTDRELNMTTLKIVNGDDVGRGMLSLFPVHTTSMQRTNHLVSSDNMGYAAQLFERDVDPEALPGQVDFVAAFAQTAEGDVTPCSEGEFCRGTDEMCSLNRSTCPENPRDPSLCHGRGPGIDMYDDTRIIGQYLHDSAKLLYDSATIEVTGPLDYRFQFFNMSDIVVSDDGHNVNRTCRPAMGYSFAAGGTNGPGIAPFTQGELEGFPRLDQFIDRVFGLPEDLVECQKPKPILLPTGTTTEPWEWQPEIVPLQLFRLGDLVLIGVPCEVATMAGRRLQEAVRKTLVSNGYPSTVKTIIMSMTNSYVSYLTTFEEYQIQRYEGASTIFGQHQLEAFIMKFSEMAEIMALGQPLAVGTPPPDLMGLPRDALPPERIDLLPNDCTGCDYGDVVEDVDSQYRQGESVVVKFIGASPRHDMKTGGTFLVVERRPVGRPWTLEFTDAHWETRLYWDSSCHDIGMDIELRRTCNNFVTPNPVTSPSQNSTTTIVWDIPENQPTGTYRIRYIGKALTEIKVVGGNVYKDFTGTSSEFQVTTNSRSKWPRRRYVHPHSHIRGENMDTKEDVMAALLGEAWKMFGLKGPSVSDLIGVQ